jgi:hypothetical protein
MTHHDNHTFDGMRKNWSDFDPTERRGILVVGALQIACITAALIDLRRRPARLVRGSKKLWTPVVFVNFIGPAAYFLFGRKKTA